MSYDTLLEYKLLNFSRSLAPMPKPLTSKRWIASLSLGVATGLVMYSTAFAWPLILTYSAGAVLSTYGLMCSIDFIKSKIANLSIFRNSVDRTNINNELLMAAQNGQTETVKALLKQGAEVNATNYCGFTPLRQAAVNGHTKTVETLLQNGADVNAVSETGNTALDWAVATDAIDTIKILIKYHANVKTTNKDGDTPLHYAKGIAVNILLAEGAEIDAPNNRHQTPLHLAVNRGDLKAVNTLLDSMDVTQREQFIAQHGTSVITIAFESGQPDIVRILQDEYGIALPPHLLDAGNQINETQSTHAVSVHECVSNSTLALASCYLPDLTNDEKKKLRKWFDSTFDDTKRLKRKTKAVNLFAQLLERPSIQSYIETQANKIIAFGESLEESSCQFSIHNALKIRAAKQAIKRITTDPQYRDFKDGRSQVPLIVAMGLVFDGIWDKNNPKMANFTDQERNEVLVQVFYEMQRGYNLDVQGNEKKSASKDKIICVPGHFNKCLEALAGDKHEAVNIIFVSKRTALLKVQALIKNLYHLHVPQEIHNQHADYITQNGRLPSALWTDYLKTPVTEKLMAEYQSFVDTGMIFQNEVEEAIIEGSSILPTYVINGICKLQRIDTPFDETDKKAIKSRYGLIQAPTAQGTMDKTSPARTVMHYGIELTNKFNLTFYRSMTTPRNNGWPKGPINQLRDDVENLNLRFSR